MKAIKTGLLIDGTGKEPVPNAVVLVDGPIIRDVLRPTMPSAIPKHAEIIDVSDSVLLPGFIDAHVHLRNPQAISREEFYRYRVETETTLGLFYSTHTALLTLAAGFTTIRNMGGPEFVSLRTAIDAGIIPGPRILTSGMVLMTGGHTDRLLPQSLPRAGAWETADGVDAVRKRVREHAFGGVDFIKFDATGGLGIRGGRDNPMARNYTSVEVEAIVDEAHGLGLRVAAHAHGKEGILRAIEAGVDSLEHGTFMDDECIERMLGKGTFFVPTLAIMHASMTRGPDWGYPSEVMSEYEELWCLRETAVRKAHAAGIPVALGTDACSILARHGENAVEFKLLADCGLSPMESLMAGTKIAAEALGIGELLGTVEPGKQADFVVLRSSPLTDLTILQDQANIQMVWRNGEVVVEREEGQEKPEIKWHIV